MLRPTKRYLKLYEKDNTQSDLPLIKIVLFSSIILISSLSNNLSACQYNVRETGFADFGVNQYHFYGFVNREIPTDLIINFEETCLSIFNNSNIVPEIINIDSQKDHLALQYVSQNDIHSFPSAILVSPDSQIVVIPFPSSTQLSKTTFKSILNGIVSSPVRKRIIEQIIKSYGVILVIEGGSYSENEIIRKSVKQAIQTIQVQMKLMPKSIEHPPELIVLKRETFQQEELLLWSLGLDSKKIHDSYATIIYGKIRWIGPLLKGEEINTTNLTNILRIIGMDCECGLDMRVMQGTMLPAMWDEKSHIQLIKHLGFDPENPVIKLEMNRILRKGLARSPGVPLYYQSSRTNANKQVDPLYVIDDQSYVKRTLYYLGILSLLVVICGFLIILHKRRRS